MTFLDNSVTNIDRHLISLVGEERGPSIKDGLTELALVAIATPANLQMESVSKFYNTTYFIQMTKSGLQTHNREQISMQDMLLYHAILYTLSKTLLSHAPMHNDYLLSLLSTPYFIQHIIKQSWFQGIKRSYQSSILLMTGKALKQLVVNKSKKIIFNYIDKEFYQPIRDLIIRDKKILFQEMKRSFSQFLEERKDLVQELAKDGLDSINFFYEQLSNGHVSELTDIYYVEKALNRIQENKDKVQALIKLPKISSILRKSHQPSGPSLAQKSIAAWGMTSFMHPSLAPMLFISQSPDKTEVMIRTAGVFAACYTNQYFFSTLATELAVKFNPLKLGSAVSLKIPVDHLKEKFVQTLKAQGLHQREIETMDRVAAQATAIGIYLLLQNGHQHPFVTALNYPSFAGYLGVIGENLLLVNQNNFTGQTSSLDKIPFQLITAAAFTILEFGIGTDARSLTSLAIALGTTPVVLDKIAQSHFYQRKILDPIKDQIPGRKVIRVVSNLSNCFSLTSSLSSIINSKNLIYKVGKSVVIGGIGATTSELVYRLYKKGTISTIKKVSLHIVEAGAKTIDIYAKYSICNTATYYVGPELGTVFNLISKPRDMMTLGAGVLGMTAAVLTRSPLIATLTTEVSNSGLRYYCSQTHLAKIGQFIGSTKQSIGKALQSIGQSLDAQFSRLQDPSYHIHKDVFSIFDRRKGK